MSKTHVVYTAKDPDLPEALHTKQNVSFGLPLTQLAPDLRYAQIYIVDINGASPPREITTGKHGATHAPVFSSSGTKVAWLQQDEDGNEADRCVLLLSLF